MIDPVEFGKHMASIVREACEPLLKRIEQLEARQLQRGEKGEPGQPGNDGKPGTDGHNGVDGKNGVDGVRGEKGLDGADGRDAVVDYEAVVKAVEDVHERMVAKYVLDLERRGADAIQRSLEKIAQPKDGKDGKDGRDGKDGLSVEGLEREYVKETHEIRERWTAAGVAKELSYPAGGIVAKGYWREGLKVKAGEAWTESGALWIALKDTTTKPSNPSPDWVLGARAGRDGTHGKNGKDAGPVKLNG